MSKVVFYKAGPYLPLTENWIYNQLINLERYEPTVYCHKAINLDSFPMQRIRSLRLKGRRHPWTFFNNRFFEARGYYPSVQRWLKADRPDLVHAHFGPSGYQFLVLKDRFRLPMITTFYGYDISMLPHKNPAVRVYYLDLFEKGERFLVEGEQMRASVIGLGCPPEKISVQHLGVDLSRIAFEPRTLGVDGAIRLLMSARFREKKGIPDAVAALGEARRSNPDLAIELTIIGDSMGYPEEEEEKRKILGMIGEYDLGDAVNLMGYQPYDVFLDMLYRHHIFLSPSVTGGDGETEGGAPVAIIEAMASGMPVLATYHCDIPDMVKDGESGYLVNERDIEALAERIGLLAGLPEKWGDMALKGRKHAEEQYDLQQQVRRLEAIYDEVCGR